MIHIDQLHIKYPGASRAAVDGLSLHIQQGEIFGLLGPNGAGKTSTIKAVCQLHKAQSGSIRFNFGDHAQSPLQHIGLAPQEIALYPTLTARENLQFLGDQYLVPAAQMKERMDSYLEKFELADRADDKVKTYSGGMKRRLNLIAALLHNPSLLILDEPTTGVDVQSRAIIHQYLREANGDGLTILYTSHILDEAERLCHRVAIVDHGTILDMAPINELRSKYQSADLEEVFIALTGRKSRD
ncbi:MAG: ABC transporter ATP-binding protein [Flavobacteriales bacterium]|nr:ABC transporter ATP-binding protein [Flavobacteriales bacterium]